MPNSIKFNIKSGEYFLININELKLSEEEFDTFDISNLSNHCDKLHYQVGEDEYKIMNVDKSCNKELCFCKTNVTYIGLVQHITEDIWKTIVDKYEDYEVYRNYLEVDHLYKGFSKPELSGQSLIEHFTGFCWNINCLSTKPRNSNYILFCDKCNKEKLESNYLLIKLK
jgi:hypothetical protein